MMALVSTPHSFSIWDILGNTMQYAKSKRLRRIQTTALVLLILAGIINYVDRATLSIANTEISSELGLNKIQMGYLLSAFSLTYAFAQLPLGALLDRLGARIMLGAGLFFWSLAQLAGGLINSFQQFFITRLVLGVGEAPQFPAGAKSVAEWFSIKERGRAMGTFNASAAMGTAIAPPLLTGLMLTFGWRWMFVIMGAVGIVLSICWYMVYRNRDELGLTQEEEDFLNDGAPQAANTRATLAEWLSLFKSSSTWGILLGFMGVVYMIFLYLTWLPAYLMQEYNITLVKTGWLVAVPYIFAVAGTITAGYIADALVKRGYPLVSSRKSLVAAGLVMAGVFTIPAAYASTVTQAIVFISIAQFCVQFASGSSWILVTSIIPSRQTSSLGGIQNFGGYLAGAAAPIITGYIAHNTGSFKNAFIVAAVIAFAAAIAHFGLVRKPINAVPAMAAPVPAE